MSISAGLLPEFDQEMANTRKMLERVPDGKPDWKPHPKSMTLARLASHVAEIPGWAVETMKRTELDLAPPGAPPFQPVVLTKTGELLASFDRKVAEGRELISNAADADFMANWSLLMTGKTLFAMPRIAVLRGMVMNHMIHHRAQLGVYLRLNDIPHPSLYGPSADEGKMG